MIDDSNPYRSLLFKRGFYATTRGDLPRPHASWRTWSSPDLKLAYDPLLPLAACTRDRRFVVVLGPIVSLELGSTTPDDIAAFLLDKLLISDAAFHTAMDACAGRFVCFYRAGDDVRVVGDATCMRMICYATEPHVAVASHAALLAETLGKPESAAAAEFWATSGGRHYNMAFLPGHATAFEGIRMLVPNTCLSLETARLERVFPRQPLEPMPYDRALDRVCGYLRDLATKLTAFGPLAISLSAGLDSRITAAAFSKLLDRVSFFTYVRRAERVNVVDVIIAERLAAAHGLRHEKLPFNYEISASDACHGDFQRFVEVARCNNRFEHFYPLAYAYVIGSRDAIHVRSNIGEIGRARYHTPPFADFTRADVSEVEKLVRIHCQWTHSRPHQFAYNELARYLDETSLLTDNHGFDLPALYYWELLMPVWHGGLLLESDMAHDTVSLFNCRSVLATYLAMPFDDQVSKESMIGCVRQLAPDMLAEPINPPIAELPDAEVERYLPVPKAPLTVTAYRGPDSVQVTADVADVQFGPDIEYAFYLLKGSERIQTRWYTRSREAVFNLTDVTESDLLEVIGFARDIAKPETKHFKRVTAKKRA